MYPVTLRRAAFATGSALTATALLAGPAAAMPAHAAPACRNQAVVVTRTFQQGATGQGSLSLIFRNASTATCSLHGYPGLDAVNKKRHVIAHAQRTAPGYSGGGKVATVNIKPGTYASAVVEWLNFNPKSGGDCAFSAYLLTTAANTSKVHKLSGGVSACSLQIHPAVAGVPGFPRFAPAQRKWIAGSRASSASQNKYFLRAAATLHKAKHDVWGEQVKELKKLASFPDTGLSSKQRKQARTLVRELDDFFGTPKLYS